MLLQSGHKAEKNILSKAEFFPLFYSICSEIFPKHFLHGVKCHSVQNILKIT